jgi:subtilase family serine protease
MEPRLAPGNMPHTTLIQPHAGPGGGYTPADFNGAYDGTPLLQSSIQGNNQTVALFELDGYQSSDVTQYFQTYNLGNPSITNVLVDDFSGSPSSGAIEVDLDIVIAALLIAPAHGLTQGFLMAHPAVVLFRRRDVRCDGLPHEVDSPERRGSYH